MKTLTSSDALDKLAHQIKSLDARADVYFLSSDPYHGGGVSANFCRGRQ